MPASDGRVDAIDPDDIHLLESEECDADAVPLPSSELATHTTDAALLAAQATIADLTTQRDRLQTKLVVARRQSRRLTARLSTIRQREAELDRRDASRTAPAVSATVQELGEENDQLRRDLGRARYELDRYYDWEVLARQWMVTAETEWNRLIAENANLRTQLRDTRLDRASD